MNAEEYTISATAGKKEMFLRRNEAEASKRHQQDSYNLGSPAVFYIQGFSVQSCLSDPAFERDGLPCGSEDSGKRLTAVLRGGRSGEGCLSLITQRWVYILQHNIKTVFMTLWVGFFSFFCHSKGLLWLVYITGDPEGIRYSIFTKKLSYSP